jgi:hypothetical protein
MSWSFELIEYGKRVYIKHYNHDGQDLVRNSPKFFNAAILILGEDNPLLRRTRSCPGCVQQEFPGITRELHPAVALVGIDTDIP